MQMSATLVSLFAAHVTHASLFAGASALSKTLALAQPTFVVALATRAAANFMAGVDIGHSEKISIFTMQLN